MDMLICLTMLLLCWGITDYFFEQGRLGKATGDIKKENHNGFLFFVSLLALLAWTVTSLTVQPWRMGIPTGGGVVVYHKDYPPDMSVEEKLKAEMEDKSEDERWLHVHRQVDLARDSLDMHVGQQNTDRVRVFELEERIKELEQVVKKAREEVYAVENDLRDHVRGTER